MLSKLSKIGLSAEAIYFLDCDNHKEYLQRKAKSKNAKCEDGNRENARAINKSSKESK